MKKTFCILLVAFAMVGCSKQSKNDGEKIDTLSIDSLVVDTASPETIHVTIENNTTISQY